MTNKKTIARFKVQEKIKSWIEGEAKRLDCSEVDIQRRLLQASLGLTIEEAEQRLRNAK